MDPVPSALLLDDGELGRVRSVLARLGVEFEHHTGYEGAGGVFRPRQLLVTSASRAGFVSELETLDGEACDPIWVCAHNQDFLPMRERLRGLGAHYLISSVLDLVAMRLFFLQVLHRGAERRRNPRLQVLEAIPYRIGAVSGKGHLEEISRGGCRVVTTEPAPAGTDATVCLPPELSRGEKWWLSGTVTHCSPEAERSGGEGFSVIVVFCNLEPGAQACVDAILAGRNLGTRITPLDPPHEQSAEMPERAPDRSPPPAAPPAPDAEAAEAARRDPRHRYPSKLMVLDDDAPRVVLGRDLSVTGIRLAAHPSLSVGARLSIVLYGGVGDEELEVAAEVVREDAGGFGLNFVSVTSEQQAWLGRVIAELPQIQSLDGDRSSGGRIVSKLVSSEI
jgi:hypothetical protein